MKKLMIALAAAATTMFSFGDDVLPHGADFEAEGYVAGENFTNYVNKAEDGATPSGNRYWYSTSEDIGVISNHQSGISVKSVPDLYENATPTGGVKYLQLDTQVPLFRTIKSNDQSGSFTGVDMSTGDGVYLDTLVKFTAADAAFGTNGLEEAVDKIAIEYVEREIEYGTGDEATVVKVTPLTNFVVRAGFIGSAFATNYLVDVPDGWLENNMKDDWHRLTVRALTNIDGNNRAGFKIYLDEVPLVYRTDKDEFAQSAGFEDDTHMIFPSAVATGDDRTTISAVAFSGNGSIDDVVFTTTKPKFIAESEAVVVPFVADAGVTAISVLPDGATDAILVDMTADTLSAQLPAQTTAFTVTATIDTANGYEFVSTTVGDAVYDTNPASVTGYTGGDITITTIRNNFNLFDENGDPIQGTFQKLSEALAAQNVAKIVLAHSYNVAESEGAGYGAYDISSDITLDLNGNTITGGGDDELFTVGSGVTMIVIDSSAANTGKIDYTGTYAVFYSEGDVVIGATTGDYGPTIDGYLAAADEGGDGIWLIKGKIEAVTNSDGGAFLWDGYLGNSEGTITSDADLDSDEEYWVVTPGGGSTTFALTTTGGANATVTTNPADVSALTEETEVTITATADQDYTYDGVDLTGWTYDSQTDAISMTTNISENTTVVVPDAVSEQQSGYDSGDGEHTFVIDSATEDELEDNLPEGKTLASPVSEGSSLTYAQAYALGLWDAQATTVTDLDATISVAADGKVTVTLANAPTTGYLVQCKVYEKASLTAEWSTDPVATYAYGSEQAFTPGSATAGFYKVAVVITNSLQQ